MTKAIGGTFGIQFSIASILKQSQIFTGTLGTIFQILGAMVDAFLAPLMPYFVKLIRRMVTWIPWAQEKGEQFANWIQKILDTTDGPMGFVVKFVEQGLSKTLSWVTGTAIPALITAIGEWWKNKDIMDKPVVGNKTYGLTTKELLVGGGILAAGLAFPPLAPFTTPIGLSTLAASYAIPQEQQAPTGAAVTNTNSDGGAALNAQMFNNIFAGRNTETVNSLNYSDLQGISIFNTP